MLSQRDPIFLSFRLPVRGPGVPNVSLLYALKLILAGASSECVLAELSCIWADPGAHLQSKLEVMLPSVADRNECLS